MMTELLWNPMREFASTTEIGLALEPQVSRNSDVCLSNKVFMYLLAGTCIIVTGTKDQKQFFDSLPQVGFTYPCGDVDALADILSTVAIDRKLLVKLSKQSRAQAKKTYNWSVEAPKLLQIVEQQLAARSSLDAVCVRSLD